MIRVAIYKLMGGAEENEASAMAMVLGRIDDVVQTQDVAAIIVHHDAKGRPGERANIDRGAGSGVWFIGLQSDRPTKGDGA